MVRFHKPVLLKESLNYLNVISGQRYVDATVGGGGHAVEICQLGGRLLGIDCDPDAIKAARKRLSQACPPPMKSRGSTGSQAAFGGASWRLARGNFVNLKKIVQKYQFDPVSGILFDLGVSSHQLDLKDRGFSFESDQNLDMRMDPDLKVTAADLINVLTKKELNELFYRLGQEEYSRLIASALVSARRIKPIKTGRQLASIVATVKLKGKSASKRSRKNLATKVFLALRIAVNDELNNLKKALPQALSILKPGGRLVVISFHSGEDRLVKSFIKTLQVKEELLSLTPKPIQPSMNEIEDNPRSRSAKLRVAEKVS